MVALIKVLKLAYLIAALSHFCVIDAIPSSKFDQLENDWFGGTKSRAGRFQHLRNLFGGRNTNSTELESRSESEAEGISSERFGITSNSSELASGSEQAEDSVSSEPDGITTDSTELQSRPEAEADSSEPLDEESVSDWDKDDDGDEDNDDDLAACQDNEHSHACVQCGVEWTCHEMINQTCKEDTSAECRGYCACNDGYYRSVLLGTCITPEQCQLEDFMVILGVDNWLPVLPSSNESDYMNSSTPLHLPLTDLIYGNGSQSESEEVIWIYDDNLQECAHNEVFVNSTEFSPGSDECCFGSRCAVTPESQSRQGYCPCAPGCARLDMNCVHEDDCPEVHDALYDAL